MAVTIYGIRACDTMKKARAWLDAHAVTYSFHDYKSAGISAGQLESWAAQLGWSVLLNCAGTTFRKLDEAEKTDLDEAKAIALMQAHPSLIKRPVLDLDGTLLVGFKPEAYEEAFARRA